MYTLHVPVALPDGYFFGVDGRAPVPPLLGNLELTCAMPSGDPPFALQISGFETVEAAKAFLPRLELALHWASIRMGHGMTPNLQAPIENKQKFYDGNTPQIMLTSLGAKPMFSSVSTSNGTHLAVLSAHLNEALGFDPAIEPRVTLALELFATNHFVGGSLAQFVTLFTVLEVLVEDKSSNGKRGMVVSLVKKLRAADGRHDSKQVAKTLQDLYAKRNTILHDGGKIDASALAAMNTIVKDVLRVLVVKNSTLANLL